MPNNHFIIVGGMRCGSSYLAGLLDSHPEICMAQPYIGSEPKFFLRKDINKMGYIDYYNEYFLSSNKSQILGEKSVSYLEREDSPERIKSIVNNVKILIILRNPVTRAISHYYYSKGNGLEKRTLIEAFQTLEDLSPSGEFDHISMPPFNYLSRGIYTPNVRRYISMFGKENVHIEILENLSRKNPNSLSDIFRFLGIDTDFMPYGYGEKTNQSTPKNHVTPPRIIDDLQDFFAPHNSILSTELGLNLQFWGP